MLILILITLLSSIGYSIWIKATDMIMIVYLIIFIFPIFFILSTLLKPLFIRIKKPEGILISINEVPSLNNFISQLQQKFNFPPVDEIFISDELNACILQIPRFGIIGFNRNYLKIGLPLMAVLSLDQFKACLAHEFGHLSKNHGRFSGWIYRLHSTWFALTEHYGSQGRSILLFRWFLNRFFPYFSAYTFVLRRANEYEADQCSEEATSPQIAALSLVNITIRRHIIYHEIWPKIFQQIKENTPAPQNAISLVIQEISKVCPTESVLKAIDLNLKLKTLTNDSHPSLSDRLIALGIPGEQIRDFILNTYMEGNYNHAAVSLLGEKYASFLSELDGLWYEKNSKVWENNCRKYQETLDSLKRLEEKQKYQNLNDKEDWKLATLTLFIKGDQEAEPLLSNFLKNHPNHIRANLIMGKILLNKGDKSGIEYLESVIKKNPQYFQDIVSSIFSFFAKQGRENDFRKYMDTLNQMHRESVNRFRKRIMQGNKKSIKHHNLSSEDIEDIVKQIRKVKGIDKAYLVRNQSSEDTEEPIFILAIIRKKQFFELNYNVNNKKILDQLWQNLVFPYDYTAVVFHNSSPPLYKRVKKVKNSLIYKK
ncbi:MAG: M48 family metalloprotease [bacterium]